MVYIPKRPGQTYTVDSHGREIPQKGAKKPADSKPEDAPKRDAPAHP